MSRLSAHPSNQPIARRALQIRRALFSALTSANRDNHLKLEKELSVGRDLAPHSPISLVNQNQSEYVDLTVNVIALINA
jgi:hypothetical protein